MYAVFLKLLNLSLEAAWLILAVLVLRLLLTRAQKSVRCAMWGIVGLRLILPFSVESVLSLLPSREVLSPETVRYDPAPTIHTGVATFDSAVNPTFSRTFAPAPAASVNPLHVLTTVAAWVWLAGMLVLVGYFIFSALSLRRMVSGSAEAENRVMESPRIPSPFVFGLIDPKVYLPEGLDPESRRYVVAHELAHIRRHDHLFKPLAFLVLAVYWFNPLIWLAYVLLCRDIELACDEYVLTELGAGCKKAYSQALLSAVTFHRHVAACPVAFGEGKLTQRVKNVLRWKKPVLWVTALSVLVCAALAVCFLTDPRDRTEDLAGRYILTTNVDYNMGGDFWILLREDGTMEYSEGRASSVLGEGTWKLDGDRVTLTESGGAGRTFVFDLKISTLVYDANASDQFTYVQLLDGMLFERDDGGPRGEVTENPENYVPPRQLRLLCRVESLDAGIGGRGTCTLSVTEIHDPSGGDLPETLRLADGTEAPLEPGLTFTTGYSALSGALRAGGTVSLTLDCSAGAVPALPETVSLLPEEGGAPGLYGFSSGAGAEGTLRLGEDGAFTLDFTDSEGEVMSFQGRWTYADGRVTLTETAAPETDRASAVLRFSCGDGWLEYSASDSEWPLAETNLPDGAVFYRLDGTDAAGRSLITFGPYTLEITGSNEAVVRETDSGEEIWRGDGYSQFSMPNMFDQNILLLRRGGTYMAVDLSEGRAYPIRLETDPDARMTPHSYDWPGGDWLTFDLFGAMAIYTVGDGYALSSKTPEFYTSLFSKALTSDGASAENLAAVLADVFDMDPERFLTQLAVQEEEIQDLAAGLLVYRKDCFNLDAFRAQVEPYLTGDGYAADGAKAVIGELDSYIDRNYPDGYRFDTVAEIVDRAERENIPTDRTEEVFYSRDGTDYLFPSVRSALVVVRYEDGTEEPVSSALEGGRITISDLDRFHIGYTARPSADAARAQLEDLLSVGPGALSEAVEKMKSGDLSSPLAGTLTSGLRSDPAGTLRMLKELSGGDAELLDGLLDLTALCCTPDAETADYFDALMVSLWDADPVGAQARALSEDINSLMAERAVTMTPPVYEGVPLKQEPFVWSPEVPSKPAGLTAMPDWVPSRPLNAGSALPELEGRQFAGFDDLPDLSKLHEWKIIPGGGTDADLPSLRARMERAALALWGEYTRQDTDTGGAWSSPRVDGFQETLSLSVKDGVSISYRSWNEYAEYAPYYNGDPADAETALAAVRGLASKLGFDTFTEAQPAWDVSERGKVYDFSWTVPYDGLPNGAASVWAETICGRVTCFRVDLPAVTPVTDGAPRWFLTPEQALYCVNYARSQAHLSAAEGDESFRSELLNAPTPTGVTLEWSAMFTADPSAETPAYFFRFEGPEYLKEGAPWRDTCTAAVDAYTGDIRMTAGWEEWESPYAAE